MADLDIDQLYSAYSTDPSPDNLSKVVRALEPTINYNLGSMGADRDPFVRAKAMSYAADAVKKFSPTGGAGLPTFLSSQLRQLTRTVRQSRSPVRIPERIQIEAMKLNHARKSFFDEHNREPDTLELADFTGVPVKRIEKIRKYQVAVPSEEAMGETEQEGPDFQREALEYVYHDSDHVDRRVMELKMGYAGHPVMQPKDIGVALGLTPTQLSRRSARLAMRINNIVNSLTK